MDFNTWKALVDIKLEALSGFCSDDIPDYDYWDNWKDGISVQDTAQEALYNAGLCW